MTKSFLLSEEEHSSESLQLIEQFKSSLREKQSYLFNNLSYEHLSDWLREHEVFSEAHMEFIETAETRREKVMRLLDILSRRSTKDYQIFITCLKSCQHQHVADLLQNGGG